MSIIAISRISYSKGEEIAEKVAQELGFECISREVIILEASEKFNVPETKLIHAIHDAPSLLDCYSLEKKRLIAYMRWAVLEHLRKDNIVYQGLVGHFFVKGISHVLKVRIIAGLEDRAKLEVKREGISKAEALHILRKDDEEQRRWGQYLYDIDPSDASLYDLVINTHKATVDKAVDTICQAAGLASFQTSPESKKMMDDLVLSAEVEAALIGLDYKFEVFADNGVVFVKVEGPLPQEVTLSYDIERIAGSMPGVEEIRTEVV